MVRYTRTNPGSTFRVGTRYWHSLTLSTLRSEAMGPLHSRISTSGDPHAKPLFSDVSQWILFSIIIILSKNFMNGGESTIEIEGIDVIIGGELEINDAPTSQEAGPSTPTPTTPVTETFFFDNPGHFQCYRDAKVSGPYVAEMQKSGCPWVVHGYQKPKILFANGQICDARHFLKAATPAQLRELHTLGFSRCVGQENYRPD